MCHKEPVMSLDFDCMNAKGVSGSSEKILSVWILDEQQNLKVRTTIPSGLPIQPYNTCTAAARMFS